MFVMLRTLQTNSVILCMLNGCSVLAARKSLQSVTNELDKLKLHSDIDKFVLNVPAVAVVVIRARFSSL